MNISGSFKKLFFLHFEWMALTAGLLLMALLDPFAEAATLCPVERLGFEFCPGEGLGRSISHAFRGDFLASISMHPAGILAILIIIGRIGSIFRRNLNIKHNNSEQ
jgi:hypothetical protein